MAMKETNFLATVLHNFNPFQLRIFKTKHGRARNGGQTVDLQETLIGREVDGERDVVFAVRQGY